MALALLGQALLLLALLLAVGGSIASFIGGRRLVRAGDVALLPLEDQHPQVVAWRVTGDPWADLGMRATRTLLVVTGAASLALLLALVGSDFSLSYVAGRTNDALPLGFKLTALWSGQEGSLLLWLLLLGAFGTLMLRGARRRQAPAGMVTYANGVLLAVATFFAALVAIAARPFALASTLAGDGAGMSPSLQNYWMALHPPALYLGYVGVTVPFALVCGSLLARRTDDAWVPLVRRWSLVAWIALSAGLLLGARWAYEEIGWGGYWAWDPVENAALMPWLTITAFVHSTMVQQRRGMLRFWNVLLVSITFSLSIFGTFITRSGVLSSVHSFVSSSIGWWFIGFLAIIVAAIVTLLFRSRTLLHAEHDIDAVVSRESALLFNNLLLVALALTVLWGVLFPILTAGFGGQRISLQEPWFEFFAKAFGLPLALLMGIAPFVAWRSQRIRPLLRDIALPGAVGIAAGVITLLIAGASSPAGIAGVSFGAFVVAGMLVQMRREVRARRFAYDGSTRLGAVVATFRRRRRQWGGHIAHAGVGLIVIAIAGTAWTSTLQRDIRPGDTVRSGSWTLRYTDVSRIRDDNGMRTRARFALQHDGHDAGTLEAGRNFYPASGELSNEVGIRHDARRMGDLFVIVDKLDENGAARVKVIFNPLVNLLWSSGIVMILGCIIAALPERRRRSDTGKSPRDTTTPVEYDAPASRS